MAILYIGKFARDFMSRFALVVWGLMAVLPLRADPVPSLDQLTVIDQGQQLTLIWHFYYQLLPQELKPQESNPQLADHVISMKEIVSQVALHAFALTVDGKDVQPTLSDVNLALDGGCYATLLYPGRKNGRVQLRETILPLYPASYIINYQIDSPFAPARGVTGYFTGGAPPPVAEYTQIGDDYQPSLLDSLNATPVRLFKAELRAAWINPSWLFLTLIVVILRPARELYPLAWLMAMAWILPTYLWAARGEQIPFALHPILPALATAAIAAFCLWKSPPFAAVAATLVIAGLLDGCLDIQQTSLERPTSSGANLTGLVLGLIAGLALIFAIAVPLVIECRKASGFQHAWAPKIAAALALGAVVLAFIR